MGPGRNNGQTNRLLALAVKAPAPGAIMSGAFACAPAVWSVAETPVTPAMPAGFGLRSGAGADSRNTTQTVAAELRFMSGGTASENTGYTIDTSGLFTLPAGLLPSVAYRAGVEALRNLPRGAGAFANRAMPAGGLVTNFEAGVMRAGKAVTTGPTGYDLLKDNFGLSGCGPGLGPREGSAPQDADGNENNTGPSPPVAATNRRGPP